MLMTYPSVWPGTERVLRALASATAVTSTKLQAGGTECIVRSRDGAPAHRLTYGPRIWPACGARVLPSVVKAIGSGDALSTSGPSMKWRCRCGPELNPEF